MTFTKACPHCGHIQESEHKCDTCPRCRAQGHLYRLMLVPELLESAERQAERGYEHVARKRRNIALKLERYVAIDFAICKAREEYSAAQREGLDAHAAWECALEGMRELLDQVEE